MMIKRKKQNSLIIILLVSLFACNRTYTPKPIDYIRIDFPEKKYTLCDSIFPYRFEYPVYSFIEPYQMKEEHPYWINIVFPTLNAKIYIDYKTINKNLPSLSEDVHALVYKHAIKAEAIDETIIQNKEKKVYGIIYDIQGNVATSLQFYITDSVHHFLRGSLYFNSHPNKDSLAPLVRFCRADVEHFIKSVEWKK